ncbi:MAG TPA: acyltransferase [bacterium]|jgi:peptidoglycan/LPS O-acetylase OafA/YrhL|nr:acyltransferase [bacterium]
MKQPAGPNHLQIIDLARTAAIMTVMAFHLKPTLPLPPPAFRWGWDHFQRNGEYGVCMFFVISGFLITRILDSGGNRLFRSGWRWFYARRVGRIIPLFLLAVFLGLALVWMFQDGSKKFIYCFKLPQDPGTLSFWVPLFTFTFNWARTENWNGIGIEWVLFWSLAVEEQFYLLYPLALRLLGNLKNLALFLAFVVLLGLGWRWGVYLSGNDNIHTSMRTSPGAFDQIAFGALLYLAYKYKALFFSKNKALSFWVMGAGFLILAATYLNTFPIGERLDRIYGPTLIAAGLFLFLLGGLHLPFFESKDLRVFSLPGKFSYGNYLFHIPVLFFIHSFLWDLNIVAAFFLYVAVTTALSALSYRFFEAPANRLIRRIFGVES